MNPFKKWKLWQKIIALIVGAFFLLCFIAIIFMEDPDKEKKLIEKRNREKADSIAAIIERKEKDSLFRIEKIQQQFSAWDGDHKKLREYVKQALLDPDSYKHINTVYWDRDSMIVVKMEYSATNSFGGRIRGAIMANCDLDGNILKIIYSQ